MKIDRSSKPYSWLECPVKLRGLDSMHKAHVTLKFFGPAIVDPKVVERIIEINCERTWWAAERFHWETKIWHPPATPGFVHSPVFVLALAQYPEDWKRLHKAFSLIKDQHVPWIPHITVPKAYFFTVEDHVFTPTQCQLETGELTLWLGEGHVL